MIIIMTLLKNTLMYNYSIDPYLCRSIFHIINPKVTLPISLLHFHGLIAASISMNLHVMLCFFKKDKGYSLLQKPTFTMNVRQKLYINISITYFIYSSKNIENQLKKNHFSIQNMKNEG